MLGMKLIVILFHYLVFLVLIATTSSLAASQDCQTVYGGGEACLPYVSVRKLVQKPGSKEFVKNLSENDPQYTPESFVTFKIVVKNLSNEAMQSIEVIDTLAPILHFIAGPGNFDQTNKTLTFTLGNVEKQETIEFDITTQITTEDLLPNQEGPLCMTNVVKVSEKGKTSSDTSTFCVEKKGVASPTAAATQVLGVASAQTTPATGGNLLSLMALLPAAVAGFFVMKRG